MVSRHVIHLILYSGGHGPGVTTTEATFNTYEQVRETVETTEPNDQQPRRQVGGEGTGQDKQVQGDQAGQQKRRGQVFTTTLRRQVSSHRHCQDTRAVWCKLVVL